MKAIARAAEGTTGLAFYSVQKCLGNAFFSLRNAKGEDIRGTPRGLFTRGTMHISVGQIVVAEGDKRGLEIVGVINERSVAESLVKAGSMPREVLMSASSAGVYAQTQLSSINEDDLFEQVEKEETSPTERDSSKDDTSRSVASLVSRLSAVKSVKVKKSIHIENGVEDVSAAAEHDAFSTPRRVKSKTIPSAPTRLSIPMRPAINEPAETEEPTMWGTPSIDESEQEQKYIAAMAELSHHPVTTSWDDDLDIDAI